MPSLICLRRQMLSPQRRRRVGTKLAYSDITLRTRRRTIVPSTTSIFINQIRGSRSYFYVSISHSDWLPSIDHRYCCPALRTRGIRRRMTANAETTREIDGGDRTSTCLGVNSWDLRKADWKSLASHAQIILYISQPMMLLYMLQYYGNLTAIFDLSKFIHVKVKLRIFFCSIFSETLVLADAI